MNSWVLFLKKDGKVGVLPIIGIKQLSGKILETVTGTLEDACKRAEEIEKESVKH